MTRQGREKSVHLGAREIQEAALLSDLNRVKSAIERWGVQNELWHNTSFATPFLSLYKCLVGSGGGAT